MRISRTLLPTDRSRGLNPTDAAIVRETCERFNADAWTVWQLLAVCQEEQWVRDRVRWIARRPPLKRYATVPTDIAGRIRYWPWPAPISLCEPLIPTAGAYFHRRLGVRRRDRVAPTARPPRTDVYRVGGRWSGVQDTLVRGPQYHSLPLVPGVTEPDSGNWAAWYTLLAMSHNAECID